MAYLKDYKPHTCREGLCQKPAKKEVIGRQNESYGYYCAKHAERRLKELLKEEKERF